MVAIGRARRGCGAAARREFARLRFTMAGSTATSSTRRGWSSPARTTCGLIREADVDLDYPAVMGSRERLWAKYGESSGWPTATMSFEADREDLARHAAEAEARESFLYAAFDPDETELLGASTSTRRRPQRPLAPTRRSRGG